MRQRARKGGKDLPVLRRDLDALFAPDRGNALAEVRERRHAVARLFGKVGATEERRAFRREKHGQRPAARALRKHLVRRLVDLIEIGPLFAIDLDVYEQPVHDRGDRRVLEALVRHDMAPVAGGIADREQDRLVLALCPLERFRSPGIPVDRIRRMLLQVRRGFVSEAVRHEAKRA